MSEEDKKQALAEMLKGILGGTVDLGFAMIPLVAAFGKYKLEHGWKEAGFRAWLENDPKAPEILQNALKQARDKLPETTRAMLVAALMGE